MYPSIVCLSGEKAGQQFVVPPQGLLIGRDKVACGVVLGRTAEISRIHCFVTYNPSSNMYIISDRGSKNGTFTGLGVRVSHKGDIALKPGETFYLSNRNNVFELR